MSRRYSDDQQAHEKMLISTNHQRDANQSYNEIIHHTCQNDYHQKDRNNKCWRRCGEKRTLVDSWQECKLLQPLGKTVWRFLKNLKTELPYNLAILPLGIFQKKMKTLMKNILALQCS